MPTGHRAKLATIKRFDQLIAYLRDEMRWPIGADDFESLTFEYTPEELGIDAKNAAKIQEIKRLRPLSPKQPWGIFFVKFEPKKLPVVALRRILSQVAVKKRASANSAERAAWAADDLLFVSNYGEGDERQISFAHFARAQDGHDLPTLKVLGWDNLDTALHLDAVARELTEHLAWPDDDSDAEAWRTRWRAAFTLRHREVVTTSKQLSIRLAELARAIRDRIKTALAIETERGPLTRLMKAFQTSLVHDLDADGFADMYAQTIAYGLLSARIADPQRKTADDFAAHMRTNPFLRELMETFLKVGGRRGKAGGPGIDFDELGVSEVVDLLDHANMEAVVRDFGDRNPQEDPVIHFYELFLKEYDAKKRMQRGVFYTPRPVVSYIVRSVDELLRTEFGLADGLADTTTWGEMAKRHKDLKIPEGVSPDQDFVQILDPATGTGTFLVEVIDLIHKTLVAKWKAQGHNDKKIDALWNEYVPKHLLTRLHGYELLMAPYAIAHLKIGLKLYETGYRFGSDERARVYLTNALEPASVLADERAAGLFDALGREAQAVNAIKRDRRFTIVIGNPPYSYMSANLTSAAAALIEPFRFVDGLRIQERSALSLERSLQDDFVKFFGLALRLRRQTGSAFVLGMITNNSYIDSALHRGVRAQLTKLLDHVCVLNLFGDSIKDREENVFDIQQGVAVLLGTSRGDPRTSRVCIAEIHGSRAEKYGALVERRWSTSGFDDVKASPPQRYFLKLAGNDEYEKWFSLVEMFAVTATCIKTLKDDLATAFDPVTLRQKIENFRDRRTTRAEIEEKYGVRDAVQWKVEPARTAVREIEVADYVREYQARPFDFRWMFYHRAIVGSPRTEVMRNLLQAPNLALIANRKIRTGECHHFWVTSKICVSEVISSADNSNCFPLYIVPDEDELKMGAGVQANYTPRFLRAVTLALGTEVSERAVPEDLFRYTYAVFHSPGYRSRYAEFLKIDFPRLPLPGSLELFRALARLGGELVALHLLESPKVNQPITEFVGGRNPEVEKVSWSNNTVWIDKKQTVGFKGVREEVWNFHIGAYQVCEKWLKDRKGRTLSKDDIAHYHKIVVALSETIRLMQEIDEVIEQHGGWPGAFQTGSSKAAESTAATDKVIPFHPRNVEPKPGERYVTCVPLVPLKAAAGAFGDPQHIEDESFEWVAVESRHKLRPGMFVAQVVGKSMEPAIPDGAYCLFRAPVEGTRQGKTVLVQLRDAKDPETGQRYTVKRYESEKAAKGDSWRHERITLKPSNPDFEPIVLKGKDEGELQVIAELVEVLGGHE
jgi:predicted helicase/SOS-response transcriptional repressor LexA